MSVRSDRRWLAKYNTWQWLGRLLSCVRKVNRPTANPRPVEFPNPLGHCDEILNGRACLQIVDRVEHKPASGREDFAPRKHLLADLLRRAKWQSPLRVHTAAPESNPLAKVSL